MKNTTLSKLLIAFLLFATNTIKAQDAGQYMDVFSTEFRKIQQDMWDYTSSVSHGKSARKVEKRRIELIETSNIALQKAKGQKGFKNSTRYKDSVVAFFTINNLVLKQDYAKIVDMEAVAEESYDAMEAYLLARERASDKLVAAGEMVQREQALFAKENDINLIQQEDGLSQKMEIAGQVYDTYNEIYLIFFKSFKQEAYLMDAINRKDVNGIEQNRTALVATAKEGLEKLKNVKPYKNDMSLVESTNRLLQFYIEEGNVELPKMIDFFMASENFDKAKKGFDAVPEKKRTQKDVDSYNKAVNDMNSASNSYNKSNDYLNKMRGVYIDNWNKTAESFTNKHVPKGK
jgi:hypothetical protein